MSSETSFRPRASASPLLLAAALLAAGACRGAGESRPAAPATAAVAAAEARITAADLLRDVRALSADEFEGRGPGTPGEERTIAYLSDALERAGALPGNPDGTWVQAVPLVSFSSKASARFTAGAEALALEPRRDFVAVTRHTLPEVRVHDSELVFVGYGVVAPEFGWDDFKGVDVRGKTVVMLVNDPPVPDPDAPERLDPDVFRGKAMTYYGRWTYKYEVASERGAAACVLVHETGPAGYPWEVVSGSWGRENFDVRRADGNAGRVLVESWITEEVARRLAGACGQDFDALKRAALSRDFRPVALDARATFDMQVQLSDVVSHNIVGRIPGRGPHADEWIVYSAHWDHLGVDPSLAGDGIYNGAVDNATGTAALIALARAFSALPEPPERSILLLAVTAEEKGLLGSKHYAAEPLYPLERTLANINMDGLNPWGRTRDVVSIGWGQTTLEDLLREEAARQKRVVKPDPEPEKGYFYRSDHFEFAKRGVPALYAESGVEFLGRPQGWGQEKRDEYTRERYHKPSDEVLPDWDLAGMAEDVRLYFRVGLRVAGAARWPEWKPGTEFKAVREAVLAAAGLPRPTSRRASSSAR